MIRLFMTNPSEDTPKHCALTERTIGPREIVEVTESQAATLLAEEPNGFFVGYEPPDWDYYHAPRAAGEITSDRRDQ